jgi:hypothetical protein
MSGTDAAETEQCVARTGSGDRCERPAEDGEFCHQHDESDPTVDGAGEGASDGGSDEGTAEDERTAEDEHDATSDLDETDDASGDDPGLIEVRNRVRSKAGPLVGHPFDGLVELERREDDGWRAVVEVVERKAVPDTQDILGRYEIELDASGRFEGYRRLGRIHRGDTGGSAV